MVVIGFSLLITLILAGSLTLNNGAGIDVDNQFQPEIIEYFSDSK